LVHRFSRPALPRKDPLLWTRIASLQPFVQALAPAFTPPSFTTPCQLLVAWVLCLGKHRLCRVADTAQPQRLRDHSRRHGLDTTSNFFERSAGTASALAYHLAVLVLTRLHLTGALTLLGDDTLAHQRGQGVFGLGWFRDAGASPQKRVATASGHHGVVVAVAVCLPFTNTPLLALPLLARLRRPGQGQPTCPALARQMLWERRGWFPGRRFILVGDGGYAAKGLLLDLDERVTFVGRMRGDAAVYDPQVPRAKAGRRGRKAQKGPRLPSPKAAAAKADRQRSAAGSGCGRRWR
jgi:hypothetical protein